MLIVGIVGKGIDRYAAARSEDSGHFKIARIHEAHEVFHDYVDAVLVEIAMVAEAEQIEFQALALNHVLARNVGDYDLGEVGLSGLGAEGGELRAVESDYVFILRMLVLESLKDFRGVFCGVFHACVSEQADPLKFVFVSHRLQIFLQNYKNTATLSNILFLLAAKLGIERQDLASVVGVHGPPVAQVVPR